MFINKLSHLYTKYTETNKKQKRKHTAIMNGYVVYVFVLLMHNNKRNKKCFKEK